MKTAEIAPEIAEAWNRLAVQIRERLTAEARERIASQAETPSGLADDAEAMQALKEYLNMADKIDTVQEKAASENFVRAEINAVRIEINAVRAEINAAKTDLVKWIVGAGIGVAGIVAAAAGVIIAFITQL